MAAAVGLLGASPSYERINASAQWPYIIDHTRGSLWDQEGVDPLSHNLNLTFRFFPRLVGKVLQFSEPWHYLVLQALFGLVLLWAIAKCVAEVTDDRVIATLVTVGVACTWAGASGWITTDGNFDAIALSLLAVAMVTRRWPVVGVAALAASFTDERALLALPLVLLWHLGRPQPATPHTPFVRMRWTTAAVICCVVPVLSLGTRAWLKGRYDLIELRNFSPGNPFAQLNNYPVGLWSALEGLWLVTVAGMVAAWHERRRFEVILGALTVGGVLGAGVSVFDITRSVIYVLPMVLVAFAWMGRLPNPFLRRLTWAALAASVLWPVVYAGGETKVSWAYPLPLQVIRAVFHLGG